MTEVDPTKAGAEQVAPLQPPVPMEPVLTLTIPAPVAQVARAA